MKKSSEINNTEEKSDFEKKIISVPVISNSIIEFLDKKEEKSDFESVPVISNSIIEFLDKKEEKSDFEKKIMSVPVISNPIIEFLDKKDRLNLMNTSKKIQIGVVGSIPYRANGMYVGYLNYIQKTLDGIFGDTEDETLYAIANEAYESDLSGLCESLVNNKVNQQENFHFNIENRKINSFLELCLKIYMMHMILLDLLSITEEDFTNCDVLENSSTKLAIKKIIKKRQPERIEKIFDIVVNKEKCEVKTFWDELKMVIEEKKYNKLQDESKNESRDTVYLFLFNKIFGKKDGRGNIVHQIDRKTKDYEDILPTQGEIKNKITETENRLREEQKNLETLGNECKKLQDLKDKKGELGNLGKEYQLIANLLKTLIEDKLEKDDEDLSNKISRTQETIEIIKGHIAEAKNDLGIKKMLDENSKFVEDMSSIAKNRLGDKYISDFLLNHPDRISSTNFSNYGIISFISYLLKNNQHEYFYPAIIKIACVICEKRYDFQSNIRNAINTLRNSNTNVNIDFIKKILLDSYSGLGTVFSEHRLQYVSSFRFDWLSPDIEITFLNIVLSIFLTIAVCGACVCILITLWGIATPEQLCLLVLSVVLFGMCGGACCKYPAVISFFCDYPSRKKRRVIYDCAILQLNECKQRTEVCKNKLTKQKEVFDKYSKRDQEQPIQDQTKNEEEITTSLV